MASSTIVIATPHRRNDRLEARVRERLPGYTVVRLRTKEDLSPEALDSIRPEFVFFPHWSSMIPENVYSRFECVVFHMTDLPYGRGGSPLQNLITRGHEDTMISAVRCVGAIDAGPVYLKRPLSLAGTAEEILQRASDLMETMIVEITDLRPTPILQRGDVVVFKRRSPADGNIAGLAELPQVYDYIRMLDAEGYPPAFVNVGQLHLEFSGARVGEEFVEANVRITKRAGD